jgi:uncharacterized membrane protein
VVAATFKLRNPKVLVETSDMKKVGKTVRTTLLGGVLILIPVVVVIAIVAKVFSIALSLTAPLADSIPLGPVGDFIVVNVLGLAGLIIVCYAAGACTKFTITRTFSKSLESKLQAIFPRYMVIKGMTHGLGGDGAGKLTPVLASFDDYAQIAFEVGRSRDGRVTLFLPGSPDPWSGTVVHVTPDRVKPLNTDFHTVVKSLKGIGYGSDIVLDSQE